MALLDLKTNLRSLKYGNDRPGSGNSGQPFVTFPLPETKTTNPIDFNDYYRNNKYNLDFPVRGGSMGAIGLDSSFTGPQLPGSEAVNTNISLDGNHTTWANQVDTIRIGSFLKSQPRGTLFTLKQQALQFSNPKTQVARENNLETTRIYNPASTLAQVGAMGTGAHLNRHGATVSETLEPNKTSQSSYEWLVNERNNPLRVALGTGVAFNRLVALNNTKRLNTAKPNGGFGISNIGDQLFSYIGGPTGEAGVAGGTTVIQKAGDSVDLKARLADLPKTLQAPYYTVKGTDTVQSAYDPKTSRTSPAQESYQYIAAISESRLVTLKDTLFKNAGDIVLPIGSGTIRRTTDTDKNTNSVTQTADTVIGTTNATNFNYTLNYTALATEASSKNNPDIKEDFRAKVVRTVVGAKDKIAFTAGYTNNKDIATRYGIGNPGSPQIQRVDYSGKSSDIGKDQINALDVVSGDPKVKDLIDFRIDTIDDNPRAIIFRAFLTGISDSHTAEFNPFKYVGRGENFYVYNGFSRQVSFNFKVAAQTRDEMKPIYRKLNYLASQLYPDYTDTTGFMRSPLTKLTIGDYISVQPGFFSSITISIPEDSPWDINFDNKSDMYQLPHVLDVSCQFTPIHNFLPRRSKPDSITPLITPNVQGNNFGIGG